MSTANKSSNRWLALMSATLAFTFTFLSRFTWAPLMSTVMEEFSINATQAGLYMSAFFAGYCITQIPGGIMADKLQPKYILIIATLLGGICTALMAVIGGYTMGLVVRIVNGLCSGVIMSSCSKIVTANFAPKERATGMGILLASPPIGILLANQIAPRLMHAVGWRGTFAYVSLFAVLVIVCLFLFVKPIPKAPAPAGKAGLLEGLVVYFKDPQQIILALSGFMFMFVNNGFSTWGNKFAQSIGLTATQGGMIVSAFSIAGIIASCFSGKLASALGMSHKKFMLIALALMGVSCAVFGLMNSYVTLILIGVIFGAFSYLPSTHYTTLAAIRAGDQYSATAISIENLIFQSASLVQPIIVGRIIDSTGNYNVVWFFFAGICLCGVAIGLTFRASKKNAK